MKLAFFILSLLLWSWGVSAQISKSEALSPEWLHLLHMKKSWLGGYQSSVQGKFFLSPRGAQDPEAELFETIRGMFQSDDKTESQVQCRFLARRDFLLRHGPHEWQEKIKPCEFSSDWLGKLHATKISMVFAAGYMNSAASSFGHTFLKLQNPDNEGGKELLDYGINFSARTRDTKGALYALYGLFGYFPGAFSMLPYHQLIKDYTHLEGRDLWEYELDLNPEEVQRLLFHLLELDQAYFDYYFLDDNCSFALLKLLEVARPGLELADEDEFFVIPLDTVKQIRPLVRKKTYRASLETEWKQRRDDLSDEQLSKLVRLDREPQAENLKELDVPTLSSAQLLFTLKELENHEQWKKMNYEISRERAKRGGEVDPFRILQPSESPDEGHHSSALELGYLDQKESYLLSGLRLAFHDPLSRDVGVSPFSQLEVLGFQWQTASPQQTWLRRYRLIETLSTKSISAFEKPLSWGVLAGANQDLQIPTRLRHQIGGRFGYSFDLWPEKIRWTNLLVGALQQDNEQFFQFTPGVDSRIWIQWHPRIRSFFQYEYFRYPSLSSDRVSAFQVFDLNSQLEIRIGWNQQDEADSSKVEKTISFVQNFLL